MAISINTKHLDKFIKPQEYAAVLPQVEAAHASLHDGSGLGNDFLGWLTLPNDYDKEEFARIQKAAKQIQSNSDILIVIGIGGSYLGARAAVEMLHTPFYNNKKKDTPDIYFAGCNISPHYLNELLSICEGRDISVNVISKSGTTTEPALAFRVFRKLLEDRYGVEGAKSRIYCTTDKARGTLKTLADREGWETFVIPDNVGGRYSVLTAVGLLPIAVAGSDIDAMMKGAADAMQALSVVDIEQNPCYKYAAVRNILSRKGKKIEVVASYDPSFVQMGEWFKQLFGESEGKDGKGIFPATVNFSADLHSMGQMIQDGDRVLFETVVDIKSPQSDFFVEKDGENLDGLNFLSDQNMSLINEKAMQGTVLAHVSGGVPNIILSLPKMDEFELGWMVYFYEKACAISGYMLGVNPFDQPGVEDYKKNMFALLGKPGFEERRAELLAQL